MGKQKSKIKNIQAQTGHSKAVEIQIEVDDPSDWGGQYKKTSATINARGNPIGLMFAKKQIDVAQKMAADKFSVHWDRINVGNNLGIDNRKVKVDCGNYFNGVQDKVVHSAQKLNEARGLVGIAGYDLLVNVIGKGVNISSLAVKKREQEYKGHQLKECLNILHQKWGNFKVVDNHSIHPFSIDPAG